MEHGARLSTQRVIAIGFIAMGVVILGSITTNVIQAVNNYRLQGRCEQVPDMRSCLSSGAMEQGSS